MISWKLLSALIALSLLILDLGAAESSVEPGPAAGGIRMRLLVTQKAESGADGTSVQVDLINTARETILLRPSRPWSRTEGGIEDHLEAAVSIESYPPIEPWLGQVMVDRGQKPPLEYSLASGQTLSLKWHAAGRRLKNRVANPLEGQNPEFTENGLYSIHATLAVTAAGAPVLLRSNEQRVAFGDSRDLPKHTYARLWWAEEKSRKAQLSIGSQHKIAPGDRFLIRTGTIGWNWTLTIAQVEDDRSTGALMPSQESPVPPFPMAGWFGTLIPKK